MSPATTTLRRPPVAVDTTTHDGLVWHMLTSPDLPLVGRTHRVQTGGCVVGRAPRDAGAWLQVHDALMSREHALVFLTPGAMTVSVKDLSSQNGVWHNGQRVETAVVGIGDVLRLGDTIVVLDRQAQRTEVRDEACDLAVVGDSSVARRMRDELRAAASGAPPSLLHGESGTGKERGAGAIHRLGTPDGPLVRMNVGAVPDALFESEMFGHVRGAFSGAASPRIGRFREADGGTLVLDEIGELPLALQAKLLRVIEDGVVRPVGSTTDVHVTVKVVASTNTKLQDAVRLGQFRADLLARLRATEVVLAPIRMRRADLMALADAVCPLPATATAAAHTRWHAALDADAIEALVCHDWPDNLRGLHGALRAVIRGFLAGKTPVGALPVSIFVPATALPGQPPTPLAAATAATAVPQDRPMHPLSQSPSRQELETLMRAKNGNINAVGRALQCDRKQVYRWLAAVGICQDEIRAFRH